MKLKTLLASVTTVAAMTVIGATAASAESTLEIVKKRGNLRCQVGTPSPGFYNLDANGDWYGSAESRVSPWGRDRTLDDAGWDRGRSQRSGILHNGLLVFTFRIADHPSSVFDPTSDMAGTRRWFVDSRN